ncbi:Kynureninase [Loktanella atrilutea]|uniref:Kynureninase n=1 Tax=Loktanella atrilutea TaxID=366533 RepID=A0A1M4VCF4_LOKAT|nr:kynureninase [Loktanella atrilutea]SHE66652.1 Kynureninase [Loktanella atrilutea]
MTQSVTRKHLFDLPEGVIYLDGNSLGSLPAAVPGHVAGMVADQWGQMLIKGWNDAGWFAQPGRVGDKIAGLIGAPAGSVMAGDTLSIKVYQALAAALRMNPDRRVVLSDSGNFPTDLYMAQGLLDLIGQGHSLRVVEPEAVAEAIDEEVAAVLLTQVDYRTGRRHDMTALTGAAHDAGAVMIWDLAHSAGAFEIDLAGSGCAFAVGCTYKYLNGGPGAPAFIYVRPDLADTAQPALQGWMGHNAPFAFDMDYQPAGGIARMRVGTPPVIQMSALEQALSVWDGVSLADVRAASVALMEQFIAEVEARCPQLTLASPRDPEARGSHVSFRFAEGYAAMQALIDRGVIGDFRAPDIMRFGFTPLYLDDGDITGAVDILADILATEAWRDPKYQVRGAVT